MLNWPPEPVCETRIFLNVPKAILSNSQMKAYGEGVPLVGIVFAAIQMRLGGYRYANLSSGGQSS